MDDLPDFDPPESPLTTPPTSPSLDAAIDYQSDGDVSDIGDNDAIEQDIRALFSDRFLSPMSFAGSQFDCVTLPSPKIASPSSMSPNPWTRLEDKGSSILLKRRSPSARAANRARKDKKKHQDIVERRQDGELPIHDEAYIGRHAESQFVSGDFSVMDFNAVSRGDTGKIGGSTKKGKGGSKVKMKANVPFTLAHAAKEGYSYFDFDGMYIYFCFFLLSLSEYMFKHNHPYPRLFEQDHHYLCQQTRQ